MKVDKTKWETKNLGEVCNLYQPKTIATTYLDPMGKFPVYGANGVIGMYNEYNHVAPEVLITCRGATCGSINISRPYSWINGNAMVVHPKDENLFDFVFLEKVVSAIDYSKVITGAAQPQITRTNLQKVKITIPPFNDQQAIASELDAVQAMIDGYKAQIADLDALAQSIFLDMFGDPVANPKAWEVKRLYELVQESCALTYGIVQPGEEYPNGIPVVRSIDMSSSIIRLSKLKKVAPSIAEKFKRTTLVGDEIFISCRGVTGMVSLASPELKGGNITRGLVSVRLEIGEKYFVYYCIKMPQLNDLIQSQTKGATLRQINVKDIRLLPIIFPPLALQQQFAEQVEVIEKQKDLLRQQLADVETLMAERMQYYFS